MSAPSLCPCCGQEFFLPSVKVDLDHNLIIVDDHAIRLTGKEAELAHVLASAKGHAVSRDHLIARIWGLAEGDYSGSNLSVLVHKLKRKLVRTSLEIGSIFGKGVYLRRRQS